MAIAAIFSLLLVVAGIALVGSGSCMSLIQWTTAQQGVIKTRRDYLGDSLTGLSKLVEALNHHPRGQLLIACGIAVLIIAGVLGGMSGMERHFG